MLLVCSAVLFDASTKAVTADPLGAANAIETPDPVGIYGHWEAFCFRGSCHEKKSLQGMIVQNNNGCIRAYWQANPREDFAYAFFAAGKQVGNRLLLQWDGPAGSYTNPPCDISFILDGSTIRYDDEESDECGGQEGRHRTEFAAPLLTRSTEIPNDAEIPGGNREGFEQVMDLVERQFCEK